MDATDVNIIYEEALDNLRNRKTLPKPNGLSNGEKEQLAKDYYANVRTNVLLFWVMSNVCRKICLWSKNEPNARAILHRACYSLPFSVAETR